MEHLDIEDDFYASGCQIHDAFKKYIVKDDLEGGHYCLHVHSNGLFYMTLANDHPVMKEEVVTLSFIEPRLNSSVTGKRKKGMQSIQANTRLCELTTKSGEKFRIRAGVDAKLVEINKELQNSPDSIRSATRGYLAIFMSRLADANGSGKSHIPKNWTPVEIYSNENLSITRDSLTGHNDA